MEEIIDKLIELEYRAQKMTTDARQKQKSIEQQIENKRKEIETKILISYQKKIEEMKKREALDKQQKLEEIEAKKIKQIEALEYDFNQSHSEWEQELLNIIIGR